MERVASHPVILNYQAGVSIADDGASVAMVDRTKNHLVIFGEHPATRLALPSRSHGSIEWFAGQFLVPLEDRLLAVNDRGQVLWERRAVHPVVGVVGGTAILLEPHSCRATTLSPEGVARASFEVPIEEASGFYFIPRSHPPQALLFEGRADCNRTLFIRWEGALTLEDVVEDLAPLAVAPSGNVAVCENRPGSLELFDLLERKLLLTIPRTPDGSAPSARGAPRFLTDDLLAITPERGGMLLYSIQARAWVAECALLGVRCSFGPPGTNHAFGGSVRRVERDSLAVLSRGHVELWRWSPAEIPHSYRENFVDGS